MKPTYSELLRDPRWQRKRLEVLSRSNFTCEECEANDKTLNVHHIRYRKGAKPWEYDAEELQSLCEECHKLRHECEKDIQRHLDLLTLNDLEYILGFLRGRAALDGTEDARISNEAQLDGVSRALAYAVGPYVVLSQMIGRENPFLTCKQAHDLADEFRKAGRSQ